MTLKTLLTSNWYVSLLYAPNYLHYEVESISYTHLLKNAYLTCKLTQIDHLPSSDFSKTEKDTSVSLLGPSG